MIPLMQYIKTVYFIGGLNDCPTNNGDTNEFGTYGRSVLELETSGALKRDTVKRKSVVYKRRGTMLK